MLLYLHQHLFPPATLQLWFFFLFGFATVGLHFFWLCKCKFESIVPHLFWLCNYGFIISFLLCNCDFAFYFGFTTLASHFFLCTFGFSFVLSLHNYGLSNFFCFATPSLFHQLFNGCNLKKIRHNVNFATL